MTEVICKYGRNHALARCRDCELDSLHLKAAELERERNKWEEEYRQINLKKNWHIVENQRLQALIAKKDEEMKRLREALKQECWCEAILTCSACQALTQAGSGNTKPICPKCDPSPCDCNVVGQPAPSGEEER